MNDAARCVHVSPKQWWTVHAPWVKTKSAMESCVINTTAVWKFYVQSSDFFVGRIF